MGEYNLWLVLLSILVVIFAAFMAFFIAGQAQRAHQNITQRAMVLAGGFGLGGGIWAMHFIGMFACPLHTLCELRPHSDTDFVNAQHRCIPVGFSIIN